MQCAYSLRQTSLFRYKDTALGTAKGGKSKYGLGHQKPGSANPGFNIISLCVFGVNDYLFSICKRELPHLLGV